ncbi:hypothetical protein A2U01_0059597, partial [Trifolium medium]|nr:hypothetical protein [Trifolium medium]
GDEGDLFSDERSESDKSESYQLLLQVEGGNGLKSTCGAGHVVLSCTKEGVGVTDIIKHVPVEVIVGESVPGVQTMTRLVEVEEESCPWIPSVLEGKEGLE